METTDTKFAGSIPEIYEQYMVPLQFAVYADDLVARVPQAEDILETAAGTGVVTRALRRAFPAARILATDLNEGMLRVAAQRTDVETKVADALSLPFADESFDLVVCQFGVMFFPDRVRAFREARRVLRPGGTYAFSVWDSLANNEASRIVNDTVCALFPENPPAFFARAPFGCHDRDRLVRELRGAGWTNIQTETVQKTTTAATPRELAVAMCLGTPLRNVLDAFGEGEAERATEHVTKAMAAQLGSSNVRNQMSAHVFVAQR